MNLLIALTAFAAPGGAHSWVRDPWSECKLETNGLFVLEKGCKNLQICYQSKLAGKLDTGGTSKFGARFGLKKRVNEKAPFFDCAVVMGGGEGWDVFDPESKQFMAAINISKDFWPMEKDLQNLLHLGAFMNDLDEMAIRILAMDLLSSIGQNGTGLCKKKSTDRSSKCGIGYQLAVVADLDKDSKVKGQKNVKWLKLETVKQKLLSANLSSKGRAMEMSDLCIFDGHLLTVDDRTGFVYRMDNFTHMEPWVFLKDGPGNVTKGFKGEWMTVRENKLYVGGLGKEWTTPNGDLLNYNPMYVKVITPSGVVTHVDWTWYYKALRLKVGYSFPGYMIHESGQWSDVHEKWFFMPRRASSLKYDETEDEHMGINWLFTADANFANIEFREIGVIRGDGSRAFSAFQFLPNTDDDVIVALKSVERNGTGVASFLFVYRLSDKKVLLDDEKIAPYKFEGLIHDVDRCCKLAPFWQVNCPGAYKPKCNIFSHNCVGCDYSYSKATACKPIVRCSCYYCCNPKYAAESCPDGCRDCVKDGEGGCPENSAVNFKSNGNSSSSMHESATNAREHFDMVDVDKNGSISLNEAINYLGLKLDNDTSASAVNTSWFAVIDRNDNKQIEPGEFDRSLI
uniref:EF-hand domain-containing protein n=1 Tax=Globodera pallida TaxID=36090 RepID=A0A183CHW1_GLOPA